MRTIEQLQTRYRELFVEKEEVATELNGYRAALIDAETLLKQAKVEALIEATTASRTLATKADVALRKLQMKESQLLADKNALNTAIDEIEKMIYTAQAQEKAAKQAALRPIVMEQMPVVEDNARRVIAELMVFKGLQDGIPTGLLDIKTLLGHLLRDRAGGIAPECEAFKAQLRAEHNLEGVI